MSNHECDLEKAPEKETALPRQGLSLEEEEFLANFPDEARMKVIKKVSSQYRRVGLEIVRY